MRIASGFALCLALATQLCAAPPLEPTAKPLVIAHVTVIDMTGATPQPHMTVVVTGDRIAALGKTGKIKIPKGAQVVDARGKFLIPGLWDMHVHLGMCGEACLPLFVANGVTSVRDLGGDLDQIKAWRKQMAAGTLLGPRIKAAGPVLENPRFLQVIERLAAALGPQGELLKREAAMRMGVGSAEDAARTIESLKQRGVDVIKFRTHASPEVFLAIAREAKRAGLPLAGHEPMGVSLKEASDAGQSSIEHALFSPLLPEFTPEERSELARHLFENGTWLVPTLISGRTTRLLTPEEMDAAIEDVRGERDARRKYVPDGLVDWWRLHRTLDQFESPLDWRAAYARALDELRAMHQAGVGFLAGTDFGARLVYPGFSLHDELALLVDEIRMTPLAALQAATLNAAKFFNLQDSLGTVENGKLADLVLLDANPLEDIRNTQKIRAVVLNGRYLDRAALDLLTTAARR